MTTSTTFIRRHDRPVQASEILKHPRQGTTDLFLVRHGQTAANVNHQLVGSTDIPLDPLGERQAARVGDRFAGIHIDGIVTSPLQRARRTAQEIARTTRRDPVIVPGLSEIDFGQIEGLTIQQVLEQFPEMREKLDDLHDLDLGWPGGETRRGFQTRVMTTFLGIVERYENQSVAVVCHGGVIGSFYAQLESGPHNDLVRYAVANCSVTHMVVTPEQTLIHMWNDISHLDEVMPGPLRLSPALAKEE
ncbi:MAG TPA: histidine phosphatase family protein [Thermomicrobiales bacterium]|nr:histidine phosphatase family protein [Thermomicrobiales bacterium]